MTKPSTDDIYMLGTLASVLQLLKLPDGTVKVLVEGTERVKIADYVENDDYFEAAIDLVEEDLGSSDEVEALARSAVAQFESYVRLNKKISPEVLGTVTQIEDYSKLADTIASHLAIKIADKQEILETASGDGTARARLRVDGKRDFCPAGGEEDSFARQASDGENPARVLSE